MLSSVLSSFAPVTYSGKPMQVRNFEIDKSKISVDTNEILALLGEGGKDTDTYTLQLVEYYINECIRIASPLGGYVLQPVLDNGSLDEIRIEGIRFRTGRMIRHLLKNSETYVFFLATAGIEPESLARQLMREGNYLEGYIVDLVGSAVAESVADLLHEHIKELALSGQRSATNRYSPGYCGWHVKEQQKLFTLFAKNSFGITLSDSSLMTPVKSVSGIIGIGREARYRSYTCEICSMKDCAFRKNKELKEN